MVTVERICTVFGLAKTEQQWQNWERWRKWKRWRKIGSVKGKGEKPAPERYTQLSRRTIFFVVGEICLWLCWYKQHMAYWVGTWRFFLIMLTLLCLYTERDKPTAKHWLYLPSKKLKSIRIMTRSHLTKLTNKNKKKTEKTRVIVKSTENKTSLFGESYIKIF